MKIKGFRIEVQLHKPIEWKNNATENLMNDVIHKLQELGKLKESEILIIFQKT